MYAYTAAYRYTGDAALLAIARKTADYFLAHTPADGVPYWDFSAPTIPDTYRDSSAAAIAASAVLELAKRSADETLKAKYRSAAETILLSLTSAAYLAEGSTSRGILLHGAAHVPRKNPLPDNSLIYGDYYLLEAMTRYKFW